jgi:hypothetical protein
MKYLLHGARSFGPYLLVELLLPGGSLIALLMWLFRRHLKTQARPEQTKGPEQTKVLSAPDAGGLCAGAC